MYRIDSEGSVNGTFSEGDPGLGVLGTKVSAEWLNDLQEAICYVIESSGLTLEKGNNALLANAIEAFFESGNFTALETRIRNLNSSYLFGADRIIRSNTMPVEDPENPFKDNDIWVDTSVQPNITYQWNSLTKTWTNVGSSGGGQSVLVAQKLEAISDGVVDIFVRDTAPTEMSEGDIWYNDKEDILWFFEDGEWVRVYDPYVRNTIVNSIINAAAKDAAALADSKIRTFYQPNAPTGLTGTSNGDLWFDIDDGNKIYRYTHPQWIEVKDKNITKAFDLLYLQSAISDGSINVYFSTVAPTSANQAALEPPQAAPGEGDLWIDISLNSSNQPRNNPYLYDDGIWKLQTDPQLRSFLLSFANYRSIMDGKVTVYFSETEPDDTFRPAPAYGDIWFDTSEETIPDPDAEDPEANPIGVPRYKQYRYDASKTPKWIPVEDFSIKLLFANLKTTEKALTDADSAIAASVTEAYTAIGNNEASIQQALASIDGVAASYGVVTNINNKVVGFGFLTDYDSEISYTKPSGALNFRPADQVFIGATWETRTWDAKIVTVDNIGHTMKVISEVGTYANGVEIRVRDRLDAKGIGVSQTDNPTPGVSEFEVMVDRFKISDGSDTYVPFQIVGGVVYIGAVDTSVPQITYVGEFSTEPATTLAINSVYRNSTDGNTYILSYISGTSGPKAWSIYLERGNNAKLLFLTSNTPYFTFPDNSSTSPSNPAVRFRAAYQGMATALASGDIEVSDNNGDPVPGITYANVVVNDSTSNDAGGLTHNGSLEFDLPYDEISSIDFPIIVKVQKGTYLDTLEVSRLVGSTSVVLSIAPDTFFFLFEDEVSTSPQNSEIIFNITHQNLSTAPVAGNVTIEDAAATTYSPVSFVSAPGGTGKSTFQLPWSALTTAVFPITVTVTDESLTDVTTIRKLVGGVDAITGLLTNESHVVPADELGALAVGALTDAKGSFDIYRGSDKQNADYTYTIHEAIGASATIDSSGGSTSGAYQITAMSANRATVTFQAVNNGVPIRKTMSLAKSIAGVNARNLRLASTAQIFEFDGDNRAKNSAATITFTVTAVNLGTVTWTATDENGVTKTLTGSGTSRTLSITNFGAAQRVKVTASATHNSITYTDSITVAKLVEGSNALQVLFSNENHTFFADEYGTVATEDFDTGNTVVSLYRGTTPINYNGTPTNNTFRFGTVVLSSGLVRDNTETAPTFGVSAMGDDFGYADIPVIYRDPNGNDITLTRRVSYSKARTGFNARVLRLSSNSYTFEFDGDNKAINPSQSISFSALKQNVGTVTFTATNEAAQAVTLTGTGNDRSLSITNFGTSQRVTVVASATYTDEAGSTITLTDQITVVRLRGSTPAVAVLLSNESHTFSADPNGTILTGDFDTGNCVVRVLRGFEEIAYNATPTNNTFRFGTFTPTNVTRDTGETAPTIGINAMSANSGNLAFQIIYRDPNGVDRTFDRQISYAKAKIGATARSVVLAATSQIFQFNAYGAPLNSADTITFNATKTLIGESLVWTAVDQSGAPLTLTGTGNSRSLSVTNFGTSTSAKIRAEVTTTIDGTNFVYFDEISVVKLQQGTDNISVLLDNEAHTFAADEDGVISSFTGGNALIRVFRGNSAVTYNATPTNDTFRIGTIVATNVTRDTGIALPTVGISAMSQDSGTLSIPITYRSPSGVDTTFTKVVSYSRSRRGVAARSIRLVSSKQTFEFDARNTALNLSDSIVFSAVRTGLGTATFTAKNQNNVDVTLTGTGDNRTLSVANFGLAQTVTVTVSASSVIGGVNTTFTDQVTVVRLREGAEAIQVVLSNEAHTFYADEEGNVLESEYAGGNSNIKLYRGVDQITYNATPTNNTFRLGTVSGTNVTAAALTGANVGVTDMSPSANSGSLTVPIIYRNAQGADTTITRVISYSKSRAGTDARNLRLVASDQIFLFEGDDTTPADSGQVISFTAIRSFLADVTWAAVDENDTPVSLTAGANNDEKSISITDFGTSRKVTVTVSVFDAVTNQTYSDTMTAIRVKQGVQGKNAIQVILSNENHTFFADELGVVSDFASGNSTITVFNGSAVVSYSATQVNNTWRFGTFVPTNVTRNVSVTAPSVGISAMSDDYGSLTVPVIYTNEDGENVTFAKSISYTKSRAGTAARLIRLSANTLLFGFDSQGQAIVSGQTITLTANKTNLGTTTWTAVDQAGTNRNAWLTGTGDTRTVSITNFGASEYLNVTVSATANSVTYSDTIRLQRVKDGSDAITVLGSNEDHTFVADEGGVIQTSDLNGGNCTFSVYRGITPVTYNATPTNNTFRFGTITVSGVTRDLTEVAPTVGITAMSSETGTMTVPIIYRNAQGTDTTITRTITYGRTRAGRDARWIAVVPSEQVFRFSGDNIALNSSQAITFTLFGNLVDLNTATVTAENEIGTALTLTGSGTTRTLSIANFGAATFALVKVQAVVTVNGVTQTLKDQVTVARVRDGSNNVQVLLTNEAHTFAADEDGVVSSYTSGNSDVTVYRGLTQVSYNATPTNNTWRFGTFAVSNVTRNTGLAAPSVGINAMSQDGGTLTVPVIYRDPNGVDTTVNRVITYAKSRAGKMARGIQLYSSGQVFTFNEFNAPVNAGASITFTSININLPSPTFTAVNQNGTAVTLTAGGSADEKILTVANFGTAEYVKVTASYVYNTVTYSDVVTIVRVKNGSSNVQVILTNENHTFNATEAGVVSDYGQGDSQVIVYRGANAVSYHATNTNAWRFGTMVATGVTANGSLLPPYVGISAMSGDVGSLSIPIIYKDENGIDSTVTKLLSYSKARSGVNARNLRLLASAQQFNYDSSNQPINSSASITFTSFASFLAGTITWTAVDHTGAALTLTGTGSTRTLTIANFGASTFATVTISVNDTVNGSTTTYTDRITVVRVKDGATGTTGADGVSALQVVLSNENTTYALDAQGNYEGSIADGNSNVKVFLGTTEVAYNATPTNNTFRFGTFTPSSVTRNTGLAAPLVGISAMAADQGSLAFQIIYRTAAGSDITLNRVINYSRVKAGYDAREFYMISDRQLFEYNGDNIAKNAGVSAQFDVTKSSTIGTVTFAAVNNSGSGVTLSNGSSATQKLLTIANFGSAQWVKVTATATDSVTSTAYSDTITLHRVVDGSTVVQVLATNEAHTFKADENGTITSALSDGNSTIRVFRGSTEITYNATPTNNTFRIGTITPTAGLTVSQTNAVIAVTGMTIDAGTVSIPVTYRDPNGADTTYTKVLSYTKARSGIVARALAIEASGLTFQYDGDNQPKSAGQSLTFVGNGFNLSGPYAWTAVNELGTTLKSQSTSSFTLSITEFASSARATITASKTVTVDGQNVTLTDKVTVYRLRDAQNGLQVILTNESHTFTANNDGYVTDYSGGNCSVIVYRGLELITYNATAANNAWRFGTFTPTNVTRNTSVVAPAIGISDLTSPSGQLDFEIIYRDAAGSDVTITRRLSYTKNVQGGEGLDGVTIVQSNPTTTFSTDKNGNLLSGVNYGQGDTLIRAYNGDEELTYSAIDGVVNTFTIKNIVAIGATRNSGLALPNLGISAMSANAGKLTADVIPYIARTEIVNYGFERGTVGVTSTPYGWTLSGTAITSLGYEAVVDASSQFKSTLSFGRSGTGTTGSIGWKLGKRFSVSNATTMTVKSKVRATLTPRVAFSGNPATQSHFTKDDVFVQAEYYNAAGTLISTTNTETLSHQRFYTNGNLASYAATWVPYEVTLAIPALTALIKFSFVSSSGGASGSVQTLGTVNTTTASNVLIDDVQFVCNGSLYDTTLDRVLPITVNYALAKTGQDAVLYYIKPNNGTALKNNSGSALTGELRRIEGLSDVAVTSGTVKLFKGGVDLGYTYTQTAADISGSAVIEARAGAGGTIYDTLTLMDVLDGIGGGVIEASNGFSLIQPNSEVLTFTPASTVLTASFYAPGTSTSPVTKTATVEAGFTGSTPRIRWTAGTGSAAITVSGKFNDGTNAVAGTYLNNGTSLTLTFSYTDPGTGQVSSVSETVFRTNAGTRGSRQFYATTTGSVWSDSLANAAITASGATKVLNDIVTLSNATAGFSQTRFWDGDSWEQVVQVIDGNLVVQGTLGADRIASGLIQTALLTVGATGRLQISGTDENIVVKDQNDIVRVRLGKLATNSFGINIYNASGTLIMSSGGVEASAINGSINWLTQLSNAPKTFRIISRGASSTSHPNESGVYGEDGATLATGARSYNVTVINRSTRAIVSSTTYDVFASTANATAMANALNALGSDRVVVIYGFNDPKTNRLFGTLPAAIYRCGGSTSIYGNDTKFKARGAYVLIGIPGIGEGNGTEIYKGDADNDVNAWIDTNVTINSNGSVSLGSSSLRSANDLLYANGQTVGALQPSEAGATLGAILGTNLRTTGGATIAANELLNSAQTWDEVLNRPTGIYNNSDAMAAGFNVGFEDWDSTLPASWAGYASGAANLTKVAGITGENAVRLTCGGTVNVGLVCTGAGKWSPKPSGTPIKVSFDYYIERYVSGNAGILFDALYTGSTTYHRSTVLIENYDVGVWQRATAVIYPATDVNTFDRARIYLMASYSGFAGGFSNLDLRIDNIDFQILDAALNNNLVVTDWSDIENRPVDIAELNAANGRELQQLLLTSAPPGMSIGGAGNLKFTPNVNATGAADNGEIRIQGNVYYHPKLGRQQWGTDVNRSVMLNTFFEGAAYADGQKAYLCFSNTNGNTRFGSSFESGNFFIARYDWNTTQTNKWLAVGFNGTEVRFAPDTNDVILAAIYKATGAVNISELASFTNYNADLPEDGATVGARSGTNLRDSSGNILNDASIITDLGTAADSRTNASTWRNAFESGDFAKWVAPSGNTITSTTDSFDGVTAARFYSTNTTATATYSTNAIYIAIPKSYSTAFSGSYRRVNGGAVETVNQRIEISIFAKTGSAATFAASYLVNTVSQSSWQTFTPVSGAWRQFKFTVDVPPTGSDKDHYIGILGSATGGGLYTIIDSVSVRTLPSVEETQNAGFWARLDSAITAGNISTYIQSAAIGDAYIVNLHGSKITADSITTAQLAADSVTANEIDVANLSAISANLGSITGGSLNINNRFSVDSSGNVIIRNAATGQRLEISNSLLQVYDSSGVLRVRLGIW